MDTATNENEAKDILGMIEEGVPEDMIRAFKWAQPAAISARLVGVVKSHKRGESGKVDLLDNYKRVPETVTALQLSGYDCKVETRAITRGLMYDMPYSYNLHTIVINPK